MTTDEDWRGQPALVADEARAAAIEFEVDAAMARRLRRWIRGFWLAGWVAVIGWAFALHPGWGHMLFASAWVLCWNVANWVEGRYRL